MKKTIIAILISVFSYSTVSAEIGVNLGVSMNAGIFAGEATETVDERRTTGTAVGADAYGSVFLEKTLGQYLTLGVDYTPTALASDSDEEAPADLLATADGAAAAVSQKVQVDFEDLTTIYLSLNVNENFYIKGGLATVDIITNESLGTGSTYGNKQVDGTVIGMGYNRTNDNGVFFRAEANAMEFDGTTFTSSVTAGVVSANTVKLDQLNGVSGKISIGKSF